MNITLVWQLAIRYLRGKRSANVVPVLSRISMVAIAITSGAMIVVFSVFNGEEGLVKDMYKAFYPDLKVTINKGKFFKLTDEQYRHIQETVGVKAVTTVLQDNVMLTSNIDSQQRPVTLVGVDSNYFWVNDLKPFIIAGADSITTQSIPTAIVGRVIADQMGLDMENNASRITLYYPDANASLQALNNGTAFQSQLLKPEGEFMVTDEFDSKFVLAPLSIVQQLFIEEGKYSSVEIALMPYAKVDETKKAIQNILGKDYKVETRYEQNRSLYMVMHAEKWAVYAILVLILLISSFNMIGALSLLVLEKRKDMAILKAMGAEAHIIRRIFLLEGVLWTLTGGITGLIIGGGICMGQRYFHWVKMSGNFVVDAFPVTMLWQDFLLVLVTVIAVGLVAAWYPSVRATRTEDPSLKAT